MYLKEVFWGGLLDFALKTNVEALLSTASIAIGIPD